MRMLIGERPCHQPTDKSQGPKEPWSAGVGSAHFLPFTVHHSWTPPPVGTCRPAGAGHWLIEKGRERKKSIVTLFFPIVFLYVGRLSLVTLFFSPPPPPAMHLPRLSFPSKRSRRSRSSPNNDGRLMLSERPEAPDGEVIQHPLFLATSLTIVPSSTS